jgi:hypothetical protein
MPSVSRSQQRLFGMVYQCQKTGNCKDKNIEKIAKGIKKKDVKKFAKTKHKKLPNKIKKKKRIKTFKEYLKGKEL